MEYYIINLEEKQVSFARFGVTRRLSGLIGAASIKLDEEHTLTEAVQQIAKGVNGTQKIVLCLPLTMFAQRLILLPLLDTRKVREVLPSQLQGEIALPVEDLVLDALPAGDGKFLALWVKKREVIRALEQFREAGIEPQVVSSQPFAWSFIPGISDNCAVCDGSALALLKSGKLTFFRTLDSPCSPSQISATLTALQLAGTELPPHLSLVGAGIEYLSGTALLPLPVEQLEVPADMGHLFKNEETFLQLAGLYAVAKACHDGALPDFRQGELAWTAGDVKTRRKLLMTGALVAIIILLLFVAKWLQYRAANADIVSLNNSISAIYREVFPARVKAIDEIAEVKGEIKRLSSAETSSGFLDILKKLAEAKGATINGLYEAEIEGRNLRIKGDARSAQAAGEFKSAISPLMSNVDLGEVKSRPDGTVSFSLTGTIKEASR